LNRSRASVTAQGFRDFEWLIVDGASNDGTSELALSFVDPFVSAISEPDGGIYDAMNKGIDRANGDYLVFLNAGDTFANGDVLRRVVDRLQQTGADFLYGDSLESFGGDRLVYKAAQGHGRVNYGMFACHQAMYFRRSSLGPIRYDATFRIAGDYAFAAQMLRRAHRVERLHVALCVFDLSGTSIVNRGRGREENWRVQRDILGISLVGRCLIRVLYLVSAFAATRVPALYRLLRFRRWR